MKNSDRRVFLRRLTAATGGVVLIPMVTACGRYENKDGPATGEVVEPTMPEVPRTRPESWDPIAFNRTRGNAGAIPESYLPDINGAEGETNHLGKHMPYLPTVDPAVVPPGFIALMWGDPDRGFARHPNAPRNESNQMQGHWYNWIRVRKAVAGDAEELESRYRDWPEIGVGDNGEYAVLGGGAITEDGGRNTIYLAALPEDVVSGDTIRIHAHCLTHGEYVDFLTV